MVIRSLLLVAGLCIAQSASAVCYYQGRPYPTGAKVGVYVCQADGTWRKVGRRLDSPSLHSQGDAQVGTTVVRQGSRYALRARPLVIANLA